MSLTKKITALSLAAVLAAGLLAGCGSGSSSLASSSGSASSGSTTAFDYSAPLTDEGMWKDIKALDYVTLGDYKGISVPADVHNITDDAVQEQIDSILSDYATTNKVTDRAIKDGDTVNIDYVGKVDGKEFDGGSTNGSGTDVTIGTTQYIDDFIDQLVGHKPGDSFDVNVTFPDPYTSNTDLSGKDAVFATTINYISEKVNPDLTDDFVKTNLEATYGWTTVDEMKQGVRDRLQNNAVSQYVWEQVQSSAKVSEEPQAMLDYEGERTVAEYQSMAESYGMTLESALSSMGVASTDELKEKYADDIKQTVQQMLITQAIAETEGLKVSEDDVASYFKTYVGTEDYSSYLSTYGKGFVWMTVLYSKTLDLLTSSAVLA